MPARTSWTPTSYTLLVEHRTCKECSQVFTAPAQQVRVILRRRAPAPRAGPDDRKTISLSEYANLLSMRSAYAEVLPSLPYCIEEIHTTIDTCHLCFPKHTRLSLGTPPLTLTTSQVNAMQAAYVRNLALQASKPTVTPATADDI